MYVVVFRGVQYDSFFLNFHTFFFQSFVLFLSIISISNNEHWNTNLLQSNITKKHSLKIFCLIFHQNYLWNSFLQIFEFSKFRKRKTFGFDFFFSSIKGFFFVFVFLKKFINSHSFFFVLEKKKLKDQSMVCVHYIVYSHSGFKISKCSLTGKKREFFCPKVPQICSSTLASANELWGWDRRREKNQHSNQFYKLHKTFFNFLYVQSTVLILHSLP